jgi:hypothetical protein
MLAGFTTAAPGDFKVDFVYEGFDFVYDYSVALLTLSVEFNGITGGMFDYTITIGDGIAAIDVTGLYLMVHQVTGTGVDTNTLTNVGAANVTNSWRISSEARISAWLLGGMPDFTGDDMGVIIYAFGRN